MIQDKWIDNRKLSEEFLDSLNFGDKLADHNYDVDSGCSKYFSKDLSDKFLDDLKIQERQGIYCGDINFEPDKKEGHLILEYITHNIDTKKYEYFWRILFKNQKGRSLWEDFGEIDEEYVKGKSLPEFTKSINKKVDTQIKEDTKIAIQGSEEYIGKLIDFYQENYPPQEGCEDSLKGIEKMYKALLSNLKMLGGDISEYPKSLEDLTK